MVRYGPCPFPFVFFPCLNRHDVYAVVKSMPTKETHKTINTHRQTDTPNTRGAPCSRSMWYHFVFLFLPTVMQHVLLLSSCPNNAVLCHHHHHAMLCYYLRLLGFFTEEPGDSTCLGMLLLLASLGVFGKGLLSQSPAAAAALTGLFAPVSRCV